jgi:hypothetical protein
MGEKCLPIERTLNHRLIMALLPFATKNSSKVLLYCVIYLKAPAICMNAYIPNTLCDLPQKSGGEPTQTFTYPVPRRFCADDLPV